MPPVPGKIIYEPELQGRSHDFAASHQKLHRPMVNDDICICRPDWKRAYHAPQRCLYPDQQIKGAERLSEAVVRSGLQCSATLLFPPFTVKRIIGVLACTGFRRIRLHRSRPLPSGNAAAISIKEGRRSCASSMSTTEEKVRMAYPACSRQCRASRRAPDSPSRKKISSAIQSPC